MSGKPGDHNKAIAAAAKAVLAPLGFKRKGQSRTWLADQRFWSLVIEFQPSTWDRGSYLNVAAHWLWHPAALSEPFYYLSFDFSLESSRVGGFVDLGGEDFAATAGLVQNAVAAAEGLRAALPSLEAAAERLVAKELVRPADWSPSWQTLDAAIAAALTGRLDLATGMFEAIVATEYPPNWALHPTAKALLAQVRDPAAFRATVTGMIAARRTAFKLPPIEDPFA